MMRELNPDVLCCFMTGGSEKYDHDELLLSGAAYVLHKPFSMMKIPQIVCQILRRQRLQLKDLYSAENQLVKALPKITKAATAPELKAAFEEHFEVTKARS